MRPRLGLSVLLGLWLTAFAGAQDDLDPLDLPVLPPNHPVRLAIPDRGEPPTPPTTVPKLIVEEGPPTFFGETVPIGDGSLVYVLDFSASMGSYYERVNYNTTRSRWDAVVREARRSINALSASVRFDVVVFGTQGGCGVSMWRKQPVPASDGNKSGATAWLGQFTNALASGGSTPTAPAVLQALALKPSVIILLTDGTPSACGLQGFPHEVHRERIRQANESGTRIDVFGVGLPDEYAQQFARGVASDSSGTFVELR